MRDRGRSGLLRAALLAAAALALTAYPSAAESGLTVALTQPADGSVHAAPYAGPLVATFSGTRGEQLAASITGPDAYAWSTTITPTDGSQQLDFTPIDNAGTYVATVLDAQGAALATATFTVTKPNVAQVIEPADGAVLEPGFAGPVAVEWTSISAVGHAYRVDLAGPDGTATICTEPGLGLQGTTSTCATGVLAPGPYTVAVVDETTGEAFAGASFSVAEPDPAPELRIVAQAVSRRSFYPLRRDGYRDTVTFSFLTNMAARATVRVVDRRGRLVARKKLGTVSGGEVHRWRWRGGDRHGGRAEAGRYRVYVTARRGERKVRGRALQVRVRKGWLVREGHQLRRGKGYTELDLHGRCRHRIYRKSLIIACAGPAKAIAAYRFRLPKRTISVGGYRGGYVAGVYVGSRRRVFVRHEQTDARHFMVSTGIEQRAGDTGIGIAWVAISYRYRVRI